MYDGDGNSLLVNQGMVGSLGRSLGKLRFDGTVNFDTGGLDLQEALLEVSLANRVETSGHDPKLGDLVEREEGEDLEQDNVRHGR